MRNLQQYPITDDEVIQTLKDLHDLIITDGLIGDIRPECLMKAAAWVRVTPKGHQERVDRIISALADTTVKIMRRDSSMHAFEEAKLRGRQEGLSDALSIIIGQK